MVSDFDADISRAARQNSSSFGGSKNSAGVGGGLAGSIEVCVAGDAVCLGDAGAAAAGILGNQAVGEGKATGANGTEGSVAQAETTGKGLGGAAAADAANLCVLKNCFGGGGAVGVGDYQAGADGGALKPASASSSSSAASTPSTVAANNNAAQAAKAAASSATGEAAKASSTSAASTGSNVAGTVKNAAQNVATTQGKGKARRCRRRLDSGAEESS